jgi:hypothetical protein
VVNRYALARDASAEIDPKGGSDSKQIWVSKNEDDSKKTPKSIPFGCVVEER